MSMKRFVLLMGCQGSGKTTYCAERLKGYTRISQDEQGREGHKAELNMALKREDPFIVVDRINANRHQRGNYLSLAKKNGYTTRIVWLNTDRATAVKRAKSRRSHPTLKTEDAEQAINWYFKALQYPSVKESDELEIIGQPPTYVPVKDVCAEIGDRRYIIVGDIHGCLDELLMLLKDLDFNKDEDVLICAGDLVDRGPKVRETLEFATSLPRFYSVMGNHDDKCVRYFQGSKVKVAHGLDITIAAFNDKMPDKILDFMRSMPLILKTPAGYVVHAGFDPLMSPEEQQAADCLFMRYYGGKSYFDKDEGIIWHKLWPKEYPRVFYGHIPELSGPNIHNIVSLDGGCVFGDYLKAWDSKDGMVHYVNALQRYAASDYAATQQFTSQIIAKREEYMVGGLLRGDKSDDAKLAIYTYTDQCVFARMWDEITLKSRGHIFDIDTGECVAYPFPKFFNLGESPECMHESFDWKKPYHIYEKLDGWLGVLYRHEGKFKVASRGSFHSDGAEWATEYIQNFDLSCLPDEATLCFEMITPAQKIILDYGGVEKLVILAAFNRKDGTEYPRKTVEEWSAKTFLPIVKRYDLTIDDILELKSKATGQEGFVVAFEDGRRVKVKMDWYMTLAKVMSNLSPIAIWDAMEKGKVKEEFLCKIPEELRDLAEKYRDMLEGQYAKLKDGLWEECEAFNKKHGHDRKTIAMNRKPLEGRLAYKAVFAVLDKDEGAIEKMIMGLIYPTANEFKAI